MAKKLETNQAKVDALQKVADNLPRTLCEAVAVASSNTDNIDRVSKNLLDAQLRRRPAD